MSGRREELSLRKPPKKNSQLGREHAEGVGALGRNSTIVLGSQQRSL